MFLSLNHNFLNGCRIGEASHPGPGDRSAQNRSNGKRAQGCCNFFSSKRNWRLQFVITLFYGLVLCGQCISPPCSIQSSLHSFATISLPPWPILAPMPPKTGVDSLHGAQYPDAGNDAGAGHQRIHLLGDTGQEQHAEDWQTGGEPMSADSSAQASIAVLLLHLCKRDFI